jgi:uncharacterized protein
MKKEIKTSFGLLLIILVAAITLIIENALPYSGIKPFRRTSAEKPSDVGLQYESFSVKNDSVQLAGYYIPNDTAKATMICMSGISSCKERNIAFAKRLHNIGMNVVLIDHRAHGESTGDYCTFGFYEKYDVQRVIDFILTKTKNPNIGIHGHSLGGAIALQTLEIEPRLKFGVIESTFTNFMDVTYEYSDDFIGWKNRILTNHVTAKSAAIAHFDRDKINPEESCRHITVPILLAHGTNDEKIPFAMGEKNFAALASKEKTFYPIVNGSHNHAQNDGGAAYWNVMKDFLQKQMKVGTP